MVPFDMFAQVYLEGDCRCGILLVKRLTQVGKLAERATRTISYLKK